MEQSRNLSSVCLSCSTTAADKNTSKSKIASRAQDVPRSTELAAAHVAVQNRNRAATAQAAPQQTRQTGGAATTLVPAVTGVKTGPRPIPQAQVLATQDMSVRIQSDCCCVRGQNTATEHTYRHNQTHQIGSTAANSEFMSFHEAPPPPALHRSCRCCHSLCNCCRMHPRRVNSLRNRRPHMLL